MTPPPTWDQLRRVAGIFHLRIDVHHWRASSIASLVSTVGINLGEVLASPSVGALEREDADRVLRAMVAAALVQLGPGVQVDAAVIELATGELGLSPDEAGELADLAELLGAGRG